MDAPELIGRQGELEAVLALLDSRERLPAAAVLHGPAGIEVNDGRVWGVLHYRTTMEETAKHFPRIAHDVGQKYFLKPKK